ncbi:MAG TPA: TetR/AcrR family transcriptional regulator [Acidimicrobiales bacterium]
MATRHRTPSEDLEPAILAAAEALLEEDGPTALSVRRIAERAGVAPMGLYSRFEGKYGVVDAVFKEGFAVLRSTIEGSGAIGDPLVAFRAAGRSYRSLALEHPARYQVMFLCAIPGYEPSDEAIETASAAFLALVAAVQRCLDASAFRPGDAVEIAQQVWSSCHGWVALELGGINFVNDLDAGYARLLELLELGLAERG